MKAWVNIRKKRAGKSHLYEIIVTITLLLVFVLVIITGVLSYLRLNHIIDTVNKGIRPDRKLLLVKEIYNDLTEAENSVKSYSLTRSEDYLSRFYQLTDMTGSRFDELNKLVARGDTLAVFIDTLDGLVEKKFEILDRLLIIQDEFRVQQAMNRVMESIRHKDLDSTKVQKADTSPVVLPVIQDTIPAQPEKKDNFFKRLFRKKDRKKEIEADTVQVLDTVANIPVPVNPPAPDLEKISSQVRAVREEALARERVLRQEEWDLFQQDKLIMDRIKEKLAEMESLEAARLAHYAKNTEKKAGEVKSIIMTFGLAALLLLLMAAIVIYIYVRNNYEYQGVMKKARDHAEELARAKERFLANISHEIRTPMNIISGFTDQLLKSQLSPDQKEQLGMVKKSADHLLLIMNDLLDLSRLQLGKMELAESDFSPAEIVRDMQHLLEPAANEKNINLISYTDAALPAFILGDSLRIRQILFNLVGNAIKFTDKGEVALRAYPGDNISDRQQIIFEVTDTGIGINEADLENIFGEFEQGTDMSGRKSSGAGLGLAITRQLLGLLGGSITVESRPGKGSSFRVNIPFREEMSSPISGPKEAIPVAEWFNGLRILVVDDEEYNLKLMKVILEKHGCKVTEARSGEESLAQVDRQIFDLVLMDIRMPGMTGIEAARKIKEWSVESGRILPVIAVSAALTSDDIENFRRNGMEDYIAKPFEEELLVRTIISVMNRKVAPEINSKKLSAEKKLDSETQPDANSPAYDLSPLKKTSEGDMVFFREMVSLFLGDTAEGLTLLSSFTEKDEWEKAADIAHKISSPCHHLKANRLYALLKKIEQRLRSPGHPLDVTDLIRKAQEEFELIRKDIESGGDII